MIDGGRILIQASAVAIDGRGLLIMGKPGVGKSSLALALIDRGAELIGDDGVSITLQNGRIIAAPPPNIAGKLEVRNIGIIDLPTISVPLCLALQICKDAPRYADKADSFDLVGSAIPILKFHAGDAVQALRAEMALKIYGLP